MTTVRRATPADIPAMKQLWAQLQQSQQGFRPFPPSLPPQDLAARELASIEDEYWVAALDGERVVGMAFLHEDRPTRLSDQTALEISRVIVDPSARGAGVGRMLVEEANRIARERGLQFIMIRAFAKNAAGIAFWESLGFEPYVDTRLRRVQ